MMKSSVWFLAVILSGSVVASAQRLPDNAAPDGYRVTLTPNFDKDSFTGDETIQIRVLKPTATIVLNALEIDFQEATIESHGAVQPAKVNVEKDRQMATLTVAKPLAVGPTAIHIRYAGVLNKQLRGFYLGQANGRKYAATQFESTEARRAFPSFDEPALKATFEISVVANQGDTAISNGKIVSDTPGPEGSKHTIKFATTPKMSSYLVALVVGDFEYIEGSADGIPIRIWTTPGKKNMGKFALDTAEVCVRYFDKYFGIKYPFEKLDLIGLPDFAAGAMENTGAITFRDSLLLADEKNAPIWKYKESGSVISHEIAHMWFGDLVTMKWWDDVWLNEGFATWMESKPLAEWKPEWHMDLADMLDSSDSLNTDSLQNTRPIHQAAETPDQIEELFDGIAYGKAAAVLRMLESYLGEETFRKGVNFYLKAHEYNNATESDFWGALTSVSGKPVDRLMATFVDQPGAPLITAGAQCQGDKTRVNFSQRRYYYDRSLLESDHQELWMVPISFKGADGAVHHVVLGQAEQSLEIPGCSSWMFANAGGEGYYRTSYESRAFQEISHGAEKAFTPAERVVLVRDAWAAVRAGQQPIGDFLELAEALRADRNSAVIEQLNRELDYIGEYLLSDSDGEEYQAWIRNLLHPALKEVGWQPSPGEESNRKDFRAFVVYTLGSTGQDPDVLAKARELASQALKDHGALDPSMVDAVFALAALHGDASFYDELMAHLKVAGAPEQYYRYFYTLAQFSDPALLQRTLDYALTPDVRTQDSLHLISAVMRNPVGKKLGWNFARSHWEQISKVMGGYNTGGIVNATGNFCDAGLREEVRQFFAQHPAPGDERSLRQAQERVGYCIDLKSHQVPKLAAWLQHNGAASAGR